MLVQMQMILWLVYEITQVVAVGLRRQQQIKMVAQAQIGNHLDHFMQAVVAAEQQQVELHRLDLGDRQSAEMVAKAQMEVMLL
jgi:hypothetical protein